MRVDNFFRGFGVALAALNVVIAAGCDGGGSGTAGSGAANVSETRGDGAELSAEDRAAADFVQSKIDERWVKAAEGWTTQLQKRNVFGEPMEGLPEVLYTQYRELSFTVQPEPLTESQKLNGATYRAEVSFAYAPTRDYRTVEYTGGPPGWSMWRQDSPAISFAVELRNGRWLIEDMEMFAGLKPDPATIPASQ